MDISHWSCYGFITKPVRNMGKGGCTLKKDVPIWEKSNLTSEEAADQASLAGQILGTGIFNLAVDLWILM